MDDLERVRRRWLDTAAAILQEVDPITARAQLERELLVTFHARMAVRAPLRPSRQAERIRVLGDFTPPSAPVWSLALERAETDHPLFAYHLATADPAPVTLQQAGRRGWPMSDFAAELIEALGLSRHQLSLPLATVGPQAGTYGFAADHEFRAADLRVAVLLQPVVRGLETHLMLLDSLAPVAPEACPVRELTGRERLVLALVARGYTVTAIAGQLRVSPRTVHKHQENLYRKLGAVDRLSAVLRAQEYGLLPQQPGIHQQPGYGIAGNVQVPSVTASINAASVPAKMASM